MNTALHEPSGDLVVGETGSAAGKDEAVAQGRLDPGFDFVQGLRRQTVGEPGTRDVLVPQNRNRQVDDGWRRREDIVPRGDAGEGRRDCENRRDLDLSQSRLRGRNGLGRREMPGRDGRPSGAEV